MGARVSEQKLSAVKTKTEFLGKEISSEGICQTQEKIDELEALVEDFKKHKKINTFRRISGIV